MARGKYKQRKQARMAREQAIVLAAIADSEREREVEVGPFCIVQRKRGDVEQVIPLSELSGATRESAEEFRKVLIPMYGGDTGKWTTHVEPESDHPGWFE